MVGLKMLVAPLVSAALPFGPAWALCEYRGTMNARTTLAQEFRDSHWVVRARVTSATEHRPADGVDEFASTLYRLRVLQAYKGTPPRRITFFTERNSGGFYMDRPRAGPDVGGVYLLFLSPLPWSRTDPWGGRHRMWINYACGQSGPWAQVPASDRRRLETLSRRRLSLRRSLPTF